MKSHPGKAESFPEQLQPANKPCLNNIANHIKQIKVLVITTKFGTLEQTKNSLNLNIKQRNDMST